MIDWQLVIWASVSLFFSAFFSGIEIAFVPSNKLQIELESSGGNFNGKILFSYLNNPSSFISTTLIGNTIALVVFGTLTTTIMNPFFQPYQHILGSLGTLLIQTLLTTIVVLITAEFLPKSIALLNPNRMLRSFAIPFKLISIILWLPVSIVNFLSKKIITKILKADYSEEKPVYSFTDLNEFLKKLSSPEDDDDTIADVDTKIFNNALEFKSVKVRECLIPRTDLVAIDIEDGMTELKKAFIESGHSKVLVYKESIDDIIGYCHSSSLFKKPKNIEDILSDILIVPETKLANELMVEFIEKGRSISLVVDEFGGTSGIVSIEDVIEEIFGEIQDEHDNEDLDEQKIDDNHFLFTGRHEIDYLNDTYTLDIPEGDYDTLGGFILSNSGDIPNVNDIINIPPYRFTINSMEGIRIGKLSLKYFKEE